jgi:ribosomal subunit interface protein
MDLVLKGRGVQITDPLRSVVEHKVAKLGRLHPDATRAEVELISERNPRLDGATRVEGALHIPRKVFRAKAENRDVGEALDELVAKLERQVSEHRSRILSRRTAPRNRVESGPETPSD